MSCIKVIRALNCDRVQDYMVESRGKHIEGFLPVFKKNTGILTGITGIITGIFIILTCIMKKCGWKNNRYISRKKYRFLTGIVIGTFIILTNIMNK